MELFLIRHGETDYNRNKRYCGSSNAELNAEGILQVNRLKDRVSIEPDVVFFSGTLRTRQTARILFPDRELIAANALRELNFGLWEGLTYDEIMYRDAESYDKWINDPLNCAPPGGETLLELRSRAAVFIEKIFRQHEHKSVACVSHGGAIKVMTCMLLNKPLNDFWSGIVGNASVSCFVRSNGKIISRC
ncbi:MAG: histidine phosphatase family protein [Candidatus Omnitrophica bacterium]|nr:histidine phosphatase family protein [Candidatus Omnitrophota bacterium]MBU4478529.1 histidine phosphatase family protein [Candidatus Omnitrophota bacterium]MCG2703571.1 histidine phosphatase family protein [Candidatus Omnitrophota bacterium]